ncbi:MAG TPA: glycosyltransferase family 2 protein [Thermodesulfobacteriota bacterium]|nr:glycosyltransferase family 2 protein [Thermodesulfobacteriota bacterium]
MHLGRKVGVVVPAYNEEKLIERTIRTMPSFVDRIIVVDDCSRDRTVEIVQNLAQEFGARLVLVRHERNQGVGRTIVTGYQRAIEEECEVTAVMAGDAQMDPRDLIRIIEPVAKREADYVKGNRLFRGESWQMIPKHRYLGNSALSFMTKVASGYWHIADSQSGYTAISLIALKRLELDRVYPRYGMPNDILVRLNIHNFKVRDVSVRPVYNIGEKSGIRLYKVIPTISWLLFKGFWRRMFRKYVIQDFHPLIFFYLLAFGALALSAVFFFRTLYYWIDLGSVPTTSFLVFWFLLISGFQSLFFAMWFDMENNRHLR